MEEDEKKEPEEKDEEKEEPRPRGSQHFGIFLFQNPTM